MTVPAGLRGGPGAPGSPPGVPSSNDARLPRVSKRAHAVGGTVLVLACATIFLIDLATPLGTALGVLYTPVVIGSLALRSRRVLLGTAVLAVLLVGARCLVRWEVIDGVPGTVVFVNRMLAVLAVVAVTGPGIAVLRAVRGMEATNVELERTAFDLGAGWELWEVVSRITGVGAWSYDVVRDELMQTTEVKRIFGLGPGDPLSVESGMQAYVEEDRDRMRAVFAAAATEGVPFSTETTIVHPDGTRVPVRAVAVPVRDADGRVVKVQGSMTDLTPVREAEARERRSLQRLSALAELAPDKIWVSRADATPEYVSRRTCEYTGREASSFRRPQDLLDLVHPDDLAERRPLILHAIETGTEVSYEVRLRRHDGQYRWHLIRAVPLRDAEGRVEQWMTSATDVHDMHVLRDESRTLAHRLLQTFEAMSDALFALDHELRFTFLNHRAEQLLERPAEELIGLNILEEFPASANSPFEEAARRALRTGDSQRLKYYYEPLDLHTDVTVVPTDDGVSVFFIDIGEELAIQERLRRAERLESVGQLTGGVAHDFNNLLTVVLGSAMLLREEVAHALSTDHPALETIGMIETAAQRGAELTQRLLAFARRQPLDPRPVDVPDLVLGVEGLLQRTIGEQVVISTSVRHDVPEAMVDPAQLESAIINLCLNARDAMPDGGQVLIEVDVRTVSDRAETDEMEVEPGDFVVVAVSDTGSGIAPDVLARVFEPFFTTKPAGAGTGMGLPMVYGFVKQTGGHVTIDSEPGAGTTVRLYLPVAAEPAAECVEDDDQDVQPQGGDETILLVEDDVLVRRYAAEQLTRLGYRVIEAEDGPSAIEVLRGDAAIDLLLTDVVLPGEVDGRAVADAASSLRPDLPVLYSSGYSEDAIVHHGRLDPGVDLLQKPYWPNELAVRVRRALDSRGAVR